MFRVDEFVSIDDNGRRLTVCHKEYVEYDQRAYEIEEHARRKNDDALPYGMRIKAVGRRRFLILSFERAEAAGRYTADRKDFSRLFVRGRLEYRGSEAYREFVYFEAQYLSRGVMPELMNYYHEHKAYHRYNDISDPFKDFACGNAKQNCRHIHFLPITSATNFFTFSSVPSTPSRSFNGFASKNLSSALLI